MNENLGREMLRALLHQAVERLGEKHKLQPNASSEVARRLESRFTYEPTRGLVDRAGSTLESVMWELRHDESSSYLFLPAASEVHHAAPKVAFATPARKRLSISNGEPEDFFGEGR